MTAMGKGQSVAEYIIILAVLVAGIALVNPLGRVKTSFESYVNRNAAVIANQPIPNPPPLAPSNNYVPEESSGRGRDDTSSVATGEQG